MSQICNPIAAAEIVGREYLEAQLPTRDSYKTRKIFDNIKNINQTVGGIDSSLEKVKTLHGPYKGPSGEFVSFAKNLFGKDANFRSSILEIENTLIGIENLVESVEDTVDLVGSLTLQDVSTALLKGYLANVEILLPDGIKTAITNQLNKMPLFTEMSEALGTLYTNILIPDNAINMIDGVIGSVLDDTGLSNVLGKHSWIRMLPEYAENFHDNVRLFQRLGTRVLPKCTYGKLFHKMDEPLAHIYNLAQDAFGFLDILDNRKKYLGILLEQYSDLVKKINNIFPICHEYSVDSTPTRISIGADFADVDLLGNKIFKTQNTLGGNQPAGFSTGYTRNSGLDELIASEQSFSRDLDSFKLANETTGVEKALRTEQEFSRALDNF